MYLLTGADQSQYDAPPRNTVSELDEMLWFGLGFLVGVFFGNLVLIPGSLRFIEYQEVFWRNGIWPSNDV